MTNPCCKYIKTGAGGPHPIYEKGTKGSKSLISAVMSSAAFITDFPADVEGNFVDFDKTDVEVLLKLYDFTEGAGNALDTGDIGKAFGVIAGKKYYMSAEMRCFLCRRKPQFELPGGKTQSLLDFFEDNLEDEAAAKKLKGELNCEEFGLATYRLNPKFSQFSCSTDGQGNCKGYETKDYYKAATGKCDDAKKAPPSAAPGAAPSTVETTAFKNLCDIILAETIKSYLL